MRRAKFIRLSLFTGAAAATVALAIPIMMAAQAQVFAQSTQSTPGRPKFVAPVRGEAEIAYTRPVTKVVNNEVVTTIKVQNMAPGAIAGLRVEEFWWDKANNPLPSDSQRLRRPLLPGEVALIELHTPRNSGMNRNNYKFSHANGTIKATLVPKIDGDPVQTAGGRQTT